MAGTEIRADKAEMDSLATALSDAASGWRTEAGQLDGYGSQGAGFQAWYALLVRVRALAGRAKALAERDAKAASAAVDTIDAADRRVAGRIGGSR